MQWAIEGACARTGQDVSITVDAYNESDAARIANNNGIFVSDVRPFRQVLSYASGHTRGDAAKGALYTPKLVGAASGLASVMAGCLLMAVNFTRLGKRAAAVATIVAGVLFTVVLAMVAIHLPGNMSMPMIILQMLAMRGICSLVQGNEVKQHLARGGKEAKGAEAIGLALLGMAIAVVIIVAVVSFIAR